MGETFIDGGMVNLYDKNRRKDHVKSEFFDCMNPKDE